MKTTIIFFLLAFLSMLCQAQCLKDYKPLSEFGTDTIAFMTYNFKDRADCYRGKTVDEIAKDLQIPIKGYLPYTDIRNRVITDTIFSMSVGIYTRGIARKFMYNGKPWNSIKLEFETPILKNYYTENSEDNGWSDEVYNYFKDMKVKRISYLRGLEQTKEELDVARRETEFILSY